MLDLAWFDSALVLISTCTTDRRQYAYKSIARWEGL